MDRIQRESTTFFPFHPVSDEKSATLTNGRGEWESQGSIPGSKIQILWLAYITAPLSTKTDLMPKRV